MVKYGAIAAGAKAVGDLAGSMADIRAREEASSAEAVYKSSLAQLDDELRRTETEFDASGLPMYDPDEEVMTERDRRKLIVGEIRGGIKSNVAKRAFDAMVAQDKPIREEQYLNLTFNKETEHLKTRADVTIEGLVNLGQTELAEDYLKENIDIYGIGGYTVKMQEIQKGKSLYRLDTAIGSPTVTEHELEAVMDSLNNNAWSDGDMNLTSNEVYRYQVRVMGKIKSMQELPGLEAEKASKALFDELVPDFLDGNKTVEDLAQYRGALSDAEYNKLLGYAVTERRRPTASAPAVLMDYDEGASQLVLGYPADEMGFINWEETVGDYIHAMSMDESISQTDYQRIKTTLESAVKNLRNNPELAAMLDIEYQKLTGHTVAQSILGTVPKDKTAQTAGARLLLGYYREVSRLGPEDAVEGATKWLDKNIPSYHAGVSDGILSKYRINDVPMRNGTIDYDRLEEQMITYAQAKAERQIEAGGEYGKLDKAGQDQMMLDRKNKALIDARTSLGVYRKQTEAQ